MDVRLLFKRDDSRELELWTTADVGVVVQYGDLPPEAPGTSVAVEIEFSVVNVYTTQRLVRGTWDHGPAPKRTSPTDASCRPYAVSVPLGSISSHYGRNTLLKYVCLVTLARNLRSDDATVYRTPTADVTKAQRLADTLHTRLGHLFTISATDTTDLDLWATSGLLATASDYYKILLASECVETVPSGSKRKRSKLPPLSKQSSRAKPVIDWQDSDDETDDFLVERDWSGCTTANHNLADPEYRRIDVRETAYSTMSAVLLYLMTGHIEFAPLNSLLNTLSHDNTAPRGTLLDQHMSENPILPPSVSPKSVYRLAHLLQREELQQLAVDALSISLTAEAAACELFGTVSIAYTDVRQTILD